MKAEIEGYCHRLVEDQEEALQAALYAKELNATNVEELLCRKFTKECKGAKKKAVEKKPEVGDKKAAADGDDSEKPAKKGKKGGKKQETEAKDAKEPPADGRGDEGGAARVTD